MKKALVLGLGKSGISACRFLQNDGYEVWATDDKVKSAPSGVTFLQPDALMTDFEFVIISPGIALTSPVAKAALNSGIEVFCDVELAFRSLVKKNLPLVAITGSNGKTTTTSLTCHMLHSAGVDAKTAGNIGNPILDELSTTLVLELSSFQLETMKTAVLDAACILNITPNHLDRHGTMEEYVKAKRRIGLCVKPQGTLWVQKGCSWQEDQNTFGYDKDCDLYTDGRVVYRFGVEESQLPEILQNVRSHDVENYLAAYALSRHLNVAPDACYQAYSTFTKPKHRIEYVCTHRDIAFYDDSKATSIDAVLRAVESMKRPVVLIAGGLHKGHPYDAWREAFPGKVRAVILIGQAAEIIAQDLQNCIPFHFAQSLEEAVNTSLRAALPGDAVLLSPGCASYDMFSSYEERGDKFQQLVRAL